MAATRSTHNSANRVARRFVARWRSRGTWRAPRSWTLIALLIMSLGPEVTLVAASAPSAAQHAFSFQADRVMIRETCAGAAYGEFVGVGYRNAAPDHDPERLGHPCLPVFTHHFILPPETLVDELIVTVQCVEAWASLRLDHAGPVRLDVFDVQGRRVRTLINEALPPGRYRIPWDGAAVDNPKAASGIYFFRFTHDGRTAVRQISVVR